MRNFYFETIFPWFISSDVPFSSARINASYDEAPALPKITNVVFNDPATIVFWGDGTKTIVKCQKETGDTYSKETGLAMAIAKKVYGNSGSYNDIFNKWLRDESSASGSRHKS